MLTIQKGKNIMKKIILLIGFITLLCSCSTGKRMEKKMLSRLSADEFNAASGYIYPGDQGAFMFFVNEVLPCCDNVYFEASDITIIEKGDSPKMKVTYTVRNYNAALINYFQSIGKNITNGIMVDTVIVKKTKNGEKLSFNWGIPNVNNSNLRWASLSSDAKVESMNVRQTPNTDSPIVGKLNKNQRLVIDLDSSTSDWVHAFWINNRGECDNGYIKNTSSVVTSKPNSYSPGIFDSFVFLLIIAIVLLLLVIFLLPILFESGGCFSWILTIIVVISTIYALYQLIEKIIFELFIINLPY